MLRALSKVFWKASLSLMREQYSRLAKSAASNIFSYFVSLMFAITSLWPHKEGPRDEIYSARWKLTLVSDQAKDLVKNCLKGGGCMSPFQPLVYNRDLE